MFSQMLISPWIHEGDPVAMLEVNQLVERFKVRESRFWERSMQGSVLETANSALRMKICVSNFVSMPDHGYIYMCLHCFLSRK